jgi:hypothetical protein
VIIQNSITLAEVVNTTMVEQGLYWEYTNDTSLSSGIYLMKARLENRSYSSVLTEYTLTVYPPPTPASDKGGFVGMASQSEAPVEEDTRVKEKTQVEEILIKEIIEEASPKHPLIAPIIQAYNERPQTYKLLFVGLIVVIRFFTLVRVWRDGTDEAA